MLRWALFAAVLAGGTLIFQTMELLPRDEAWLVCGLIAAVVFFAIPGEKKREPNDLIIILIAVIGFYGIGLKFSFWLASVIDRRIAMAMSTVLLLALVVGLFVLNATRGTRSSNTRW